MSELVNHARRELTILGEEPETVEGYLKVIQAFADMGHSGGSASVAIPVITELLQYKNLRPLTDDPEEWELRDPGYDIEDYNFWQNKRNPAAFSRDGGKTYYLVNEIPAQGEKQKMYDSVNHQVEEPTA